MKNNINKDSEIMHLVYKIENINDITHRFSPKGYEILNDQFISYIDLVKPEIEKGPPILLEVTGCKLDEQEKEAIEQAVWDHYLLKLMVSKQIEHRCRIKIFWFLVCFILSSILLFVADKTTVEIIINYAYLPFWFFGYRLLTFPILDYPPVLRECKWYARLAAMKIIYSEEPVIEVPRNATDGIYEDSIKYYEEARAKVHNNNAAKELLIDDNRMGVECIPEKLGDIVRTSSVKGYELLTEEMASYLFQIEPFVNDDIQLVLTLEGCAFDEGEKTTIIHAIKNFYQLRKSEAQNELDKNEWKIMVFTICLFLATLVLYFWGGDVDVAFHEFMLLILWFFGDYLVEYVLLENRVLRYAKKKIELLSHVNVIFKQ